MTKSIAGKLFFLSAIVLIGINYYFLKKKDRVIADQSVLLGRLKNENKVYRNDYVTFSSLTFKHQDAGALKNIILLSESGKEVPFTSICAAHKHTLVFHFNELNCNVCVEKEFTKIKEILARDPDFAKNFLIIGKYSQQRYLSIFKRINKIDLEIYNIKGNDMSAFETGLPFYFVLDKDFSYKNFFLPNKNSPDVTPVYFAMVKENYFM